MLRFRLKELPYLCVKKLVESRKLGSIKLQDGIGNF